MRLLRAWPQVCTAINDAVDALVSLHRLDASSHASDRPKLSEGHSRDAFPAIRDKYSQSIYLEIAKLVEPSKTAPPKVKRAPKKAAGGARGATRVTRSASERRPRSLE